MPFVFWNASKLSSLLRSAIFVENLEKSNPNSIGVEHQHLWLIILGLNSDGVLSLSFSFCYKYLSPMDL